MSSESGVLMLLLFACLGAVVAVGARAPLLKRRFLAYRARRERMRWFVDEFLPELMRAAPKASGAATAARTTHLSPSVESKPDLASIRKLEDVLRGLPQSERERLKAFVNSPR